MTTKFRITALALLVAIFSVQCTKNESEVPTLPTSVESYFTAGEFSYDGNNLKYQEATVNPGVSGPTSLIVVLHGQNASGSDNKSQIRHDSMIRIWHNLTYGNYNAIILAPQCRAGRSWDEKVGDVKGVTMPQVVKALVEDFVTKRANISYSRIFILGYSDGIKPAGAGAVWRMLSDYPEMFAAGMSVAADPDESILVENIAKTPILSVKAEMDAHAVALTLDSFSDQVRDAGGQIKEIVLEVRTREDLCREAFSADNLAWVLQYSKNK